MRACKVVIRPAASSEFSVRPKTIPAQGQDLAARPRTTPEEYYAFLRKARESAVRDHPYDAVPVDRSKKSNLMEFCDILRLDNVKLRVTPSLMACLYDLTLPNAMSILCVNERTMRRLKTWNGTTRWPRAMMSTRTHPTLTFKWVREHRWKAMRWAYKHDPFAYELLYAAHKLAGYTQDACPDPPSVTLRKPPRVKARAEVRAEFLPQDTTESTDSTEQSQVPDPEDLLELPGMSEAQPQSQLQSQPQPQPEPSEENADEEQQGAYQAEHDPYYLHVDHGPLEPLAYEDFDEPGEFEKFLETFRLED